MSRKTVHGLLYIVSRTHSMHFASLRGQYRQNQYLHTHHIIHPPGFHGFLGLYTLLYSIFQHGSLEVGGLRHVFSGGKGRYTDLGGNGLIVVASVCLLYTSDAADD